jgi:hypothetical protein
MKMLFELRAGPKTESRAERLGQNEASSTVHLENRPLHAIHECQMASPMATRGTPSASFEP